MWNRLWTAGRTWLSPSSDRPMLEMLCRAHDEAEEIRRAMEVGDVRRYYTAANGQHVTHPLVTQLKDLRVQMTAWLSALGFSPSDRARLNIGEVRVQDSLDELRARRESRNAARLA